MRTETAIEEVFMNSDSDASLDGSDNDYDDNTNVHVDANTDGAGEPEFDTYANYRRQTHPDAAPEVGGDDDVDMHNEDAPEAYNVSSLSEGEFVGFQEADFINVQNQRGEVTDFETFMRQWKKGDRPRQQLDFLQETGTSTVC